MGLGNRLHINVRAIQFRLTFVHTFSKMYYMCVVMSGISSAIFF